MLDVLDADSVRAWSKAAVDALESHQGEIDQLNVFPIADSDTGTNLVLTLRSAAAALAESDNTDITAAGALGAFARGAVLGARGNSGVIVAQVLRSFADAAAAAPSCDADTMARALRRAADEAWGAVAEPVDGTILTVARAAAEAVSGTDGRRLHEVLCIATEAADAALQSTPQQLAVLADAGVVDAGGRGLVLLLDALARTVGANPRLTMQQAARPVPVPGEPAAVAVRETGSSEFGYEVQYLLDAVDDDVAALRTALTALGDSVVITGTGDGTFNVHVHVNDVGAAIEAGIAAGRPRQVTVVRFADGDESPLERFTAVLVAIAPGTGLDRLFESEGVHVVGGAGASVLDVLEVLDRTSARDVILLPNVRESVGVAEAVAIEARDAGMRVAVVPTRSPVQGLAAVAVHDPSRRFDDDVVAMAEAAAATRFAEITVATAEALTSVGICQAGDVLGLIDGEVVEIGRTVPSVALALVDRLLGVGAELLTLLVGADSAPGLGDLVKAHVGELTQLTEVQVYEIGQPVYPLIIGVE